MDYIRGTELIHHTKWVVGNYYFRENGNTAFRLDSISPKLGSSADVRNYEATYLSGPKVADTKKYFIEAIETNSQTNKEKTMASKLYEFQKDGKTTFGSKLAVNSSGLWVMEVKGTGEAVLVDKTTVEEVIPYTIGVQFISGHGTSGTTYHYTAPKGKFEYGFYLLKNHNGTSLVQVVLLDSRSTSATKEFTPSVKFVTEKVD